MSSPAALPDHDLVVIGDDLLAVATPAERAEYLRYLEQRERARPSWRSVARPEQLAPAAWHRVWYIRGGRGSGKTRTGAEALVELMGGHGAPKGEPSEWAVVAPTYGDARDTCVEGPSGLLAALGTTRAEVVAGRSEQVETWNRSLGDVRLRNGAVVWADGADDGAGRIQGKNLRGAWCDEIGLWKLAQKRRSVTGRVSKSPAEQSWDESLRFAVRLSPARIVVTGTPKRGHVLVRRLVADPTVIKTVMRTQDNVANLDPELVAELMRDYAGTELGRQELEGEVLNEVEGAMWSLAQLDSSRSPLPVRTHHLRDGRQQRVSDLERVVVAIDPAITATLASDETGIVVAGRGADGDGYVLDDVSCRLTPDGWGRRAVAAFHEWKADRIVAEANQGGEMVGHVLRTVDPNVPVTLVRASRGKRTRAEPVAALYEQGRVHHVGTFPALEDQMCSYTAESAVSPDRLDALVWALTELVLDDRRVSIRVM